MSTVASGRSTSCARVARRTPRRRCRRALAAPVPARPARGRPGRRGAARRRPGHPVDQEGVEAAGDRPGHLDGRPDHAGGRRHPRQGPQPRREGPPPGPGPARHPVTSPRSASTRTWSPSRSTRWPAPAVGIASVATAFPSGRADLAVRLADTRDRGRGRRHRDRHGDRPRRLPGRPLRQGLSTTSSRSSRPAAPRGSRSSWRPASWPPTTTSAAPRGWRCWPAATSSRRRTGKISPAATLPVTHVMLQAVRDWYEQTGERRAVKPAGGIRNTKDAIRYLVAVNEVAGPEWLDPFLFRFGAS